MTAAEVVSNELYHAYLACGLAGGLAGLTIGLLLSLAIVIRFQRRERHATRPRATAHINATRASRDSVALEPDRGVSTGADSDGARRAAG